jgi:hypothetical protein
VALSNASEFTFREDRRRCRADLALGAVKPPPFKSAATTPDQKFGRKKRGDFQVWGTKPPFGAVRVVSASGVSSKPKVP